MSTGFELTLRPERRRFLGMLATLPAICFFLRGENKLNERSGHEVIDDQFLVLGGWVLLKSDITE